MDTKSIVKKPKAFYEWFILWLVTGNIPGYSIFIYNVNDNSPALYYLLPIAVVALLVNLIAAAKCNLYNIFRWTRMIPKQGIKLYQLMKTDYQYWKQNGRRIPYDYNNPK